MIAIHTPAKVNLMLAVQGPRHDGFHTLTSLVAPLAFGDDLDIGCNSLARDQFSCDDAKVPSDDRNLILQAAGAFREHTGKKVYFDFKLQKQIPMGAGLGGGSSNAAGALLGMNSLTGKPLGRTELSHLAADLGSDCPFFIEPRISLMRGRGEILEAASQDLANFLRTHAIILFKPHFEINTGSAYAVLSSAAPEYYHSEAFAEACLKSGSQEKGLDRLIFNSFEEAIGRKYRAIPSLLEQLREKGFSCGLSGSGSCCFALIESNGFGLKSKDLKSIIQSAWGESVFFVETNLI